MQPQTVRIVLSLGVACAIASAPATVARAVDSVDPAIAYTTAIGPGGNLMVVDADGTDSMLVVASVTVGTGKDRRKSTNNQPAWSPDGSMLVFVSDVGGPGIYVVNRDGTGLAKIAAVSNVSSGAPAWSPAPVPGVGGGRYRIAYSDVGGPQQSDVWIVDVDGSNPVKVTTTAYPDSEFHPTWSPDGTLLACQILGATRDRYGLMDFSTGQYAVKAYAAPLAGAYVRQPSWSNTRSGRMVVEADVGGQGSMDLWLVDPLSSSFTPVNLTASPDSELRPTWSPDDSRLAFCARVPTKRSNDFATYVMNADGSGRRVLAAPGAQPAWRRSP